MAHRIAQWAVGNIGKKAIAAVRDDPALDLVACYNRPGDKTGQDAGNLAGIGPIGVPVASTIEDIVAARPDLVLYMPLMWDVDDMVRLLEAGINVISTANFITGFSYGAEAQQRLHDAAVRGGVSLYGSGINPGFANVISLLATQVCRRVEKITMFESADASSYASPETWNSLGFGGPIDAPGLKEKVRQRSLVFADAVEMMAKALEAPLDEIAYEVDFGVTTQDVDLGFMQFPKGTVCGMDVHFIGVSNGKRIIDVGSQVRLGRHMEPDWQPLHGYRVDIQGTPGVKLVIDAVDSRTADKDFYTAMPAVNAIRAVIEAKPGLVTADELPLICAARRTG